METVERDEADYERWCEREARRKLDDLDQALDEMVEQVKALARDALTAGGYHQQWSRRVEETTCLRTS